MQTLTITRPDDWHVHFRDEAFLQNTVAATAQNFARALVMPNLKPGLTSLEAVLAYRERILSALGNKKLFTPFMTFYLNEKLLPDDLEKSKDYFFILGAKLYPAGVTTNAEEGASSFKRLYPLLEIMQQQGLVLQIHGEVNSGDIFAREQQFLTRHLSTLLRNFPKLRIVLEHISTKKAVEFVAQSSKNLAATITVHHLLYNRNHLLAGGIKPHYYCLPILKQEADQRALQQAAISGNPKFFAGTDSAPHPKTAKESSCGCAGIYSAPFAIPLYAQIFAKLDALPKLDAFLGRFGAAFYQQDLNKSPLILKKVSQAVPKTLAFANKTVVPIAAGEILEWSAYEAD